MEDNTREPNLGRVGKRGSAVGDVQLSEGNAKVKQGGDGDVAGCWPQLLPQCASRVGMVV